MEQNYISTSIPIELLQYQRNIETTQTITSKLEPSTDFGVKIIKNTDGNISEAVYYSDNGDLLKKIFYKGSSISRIEQYRNLKIRSEEIYKDGKIYNKFVYNNNGEETCRISYEHDKKDSITSITKVIKDKHYTIIYGYDELGRTNSRTLKLNEKTLETQKFRYDILDRIVEYTDSNQRIKVLKINTNNELINYSITDKIGNNIEICNRFFCSEYIGTDIELNGHKTTVEDKSYLDNIMLRKPYPSEDDMDLALSSIINHNKITPIKRGHDYNMFDTIIQENIDTQLLPITVRKMQLLKKTG